MTRHTVLIFLAILMILSGLIMVSLAAPIVSWSIAFALAAVFLLVSVWQQRRLNQ